MASTLSIDEILELSSEERPEDVRTLVLRELAICEVGPMFAPFTAVEVLSLSNNTVHTLGGCSEMTQLSSLNINFNRVTNLEPLARCVQLQELYASHNKISSIDPLAACKRLTALSLFHNLIPSLDGMVSVLQQLPALVELDVASNPCALRPSYRHHLVQELTLRTLDGETLTELDAQLAAEFWERPDELSARAYTSGLNPAFPLSAMAGSAALAEQQVLEPRPQTPGRSSVSFRDPFLNNHPILMEYLCEAELKKHAAATASVAPSGAEDETGAATADQSLLTLRRPLVERLRLTAAAMDSVVGSSPLQLAARPMFQPSAGGSEGAEQRTTKRLLQVVQDLTAERDAALERVRQLEDALSGMTLSEEVASLRMRNEALAIENANMFTLKEEVASLRAELASMRPGTTPTEAEHEV